MFVDEAETETYDTVVVEPNDLAAAIVEEAWPSQAPTRKCKIQ